MSIRQDPQIQTKVIIPETASKCIKLGREYQVNEGGVNISYPITIDYVTVNLIVDEVTHTPFDIESITEPKSITLEYQEIMELFGLPIEVDGKKTYLGELLGDFADRKIEAHLQKEFERVNGKRLGAMKPILQAPNILVRNQFDIPVQIINYDPFLKYEWLLDDNDEAIQLHEADSFCRIDVGSKVILNKLTLRCRAISNDSLKAETTIILSIE